MLLLLAAVGGRCLAPTAPGLGTFFGDFRAAPDGLPVFPEVGIDAMEHKVHDGADDGIGFADASAECVFKDSEPCPAVHLFIEMSQGIVPFRIYHYGGVDSGSVACDGSSS